MFFFKLLTDFSYDTPTDLGLAVDYTGDLLPSLSTIFYRLFYYLLAVLSRLPSVSTDLPAKFLDFFFSIIRPPII